MFDIVDESQVCYIVRVCAQSSRTPVKAHTLLHRRECDYQLRDDRRARGRGAFWSGTADPVVVSGELAMIVGGILLLIVAVVCYFIARGQAGKLQAMNAADTYTAQMLSDLHSQITASLGAEALAQPCELEGVIESDAPLVAPFSKAPCVAYTSTISREYEEDVTSTDSEGKQTTRTERSSETLESEDRRANFWVRDATGRALVVPENADLDLVETANHFEAAASPGFGRRRDLGRRSVEQTLAVGTKIYILGCAIDYQGQPALGRSPKDPKARFIISRRSERELAQSAASWSRNLYYVAAGSGVVGLVLLVLGLT